MMTMLRLPPFLICCARCSSSFKVYVDGKSNQMISSAPSQVFKAMPASMVKSIEVITNPGAKYDADGGAGVLNIVMNKEIAAAMGVGTNLNGYNGTIRVQAGNRTLGGSAFVSGQQGKLSYSANMLTIANRHRVLRLRRWSVNRRV